jgi:hypothetical protein
MIYYFRWIRDLGYRVGLVWRLRCRAKRDRVGLASGIEGRVQGLVFRFRVQV